MESRLAAAKQKLEDAHNDETQVSVAFAEAQLAVTTQQAKVAALKSKFDRATKDLSSLVDSSHQLESQLYEAKDIREIAERNYNLLKKEYEEQNTNEQLRAEVQKLRAENERLLAVAARNRDVRAHARDSHDARRWS
jgi:chromosome segregation ATPase